MIRVSLAHCSDRELLVIAKDWGAQVSRDATRGDAERAIERAYRNDVRWREQMAKRREKTA